MFQTSPSTLEPLAVTPAVIGGGMGMLILLFDGRACRWRGASAGETASEAADTCHAIRPFSGTATRSARRVTAALALAGCVATSEVSGKPGTGHSPQEVRTWHS